MPQSTNCLRADRRGSAVQSEAVGHSPWLPAEGIGARQELLNFHSLFPIPQELLKGGFNQTAYEWERYNWGCKWGAREPQILDEWSRGILYQFDTPWVPPTQLIEHVSKEWPELMFILEYEECGNGFRGMAKAKAGRLDDRWRRILKGGSEDQSPVRRCRFPPAGSVL